MLLCEIDRIEKEKKVFVKGELIDVATGNIIAKSDALFIALKSEDKELYDKLKKTLDCFEKDLHPEDSSISCYLPGPSI